MRKYAYEVGMAKQIKSVNPYDLEWELSPERIGVRSFDMERTPMFHPFMQAKRKMDAIKQMSYGEGPMDDGNVSVKP